MVTKDDVKECLFDALGTGDRTWSKRLGVAAFALLNHVTAEMLAAGQSLILEANFEAAFAGPALKQLVDAAGATALVVVVTGDPHVVSARFRSRAGTASRHAGHLDADMFDEIDARMARPYEAPDLGGAAITVDLTDLSQFDAAVDAVAQALQVALPDATQDRAGE